MNKYIYRVRLDTLYNKNICINMNYYYFLANNNSFNNRKINCGQIVEKYEFFMFILTKVSFFNFGSLNFTGR